MSLKHKRSHSCGGHTAKMMLKNDEMGEFKVEKREFRSTLQIPIKLKSRIPLNQI